MQNIKLLTFLRDNNMLIAEPSLLPPVPALVTSHYNRCTSESVLLEHAPMPPIHPRTHSLAPAPFPGGEIMPLEPWPGGWQARHAPLAVITAAHRPTAHHFSNSIIADNYSMPSRRRILPALALWHRWPELGGGRRVGSAAREGRERPASLGISVPPGRRGGGSRVSSEPAPGPGHAMSARTRSRLGEGETTGGGAGSERETAGDGAGSERETRLVEEQARRGRHGWSRNRLGEGDGWSRNRLGEGDTAGRGKGSETETAGGGAMPMPSAGDRVQERRAAAAA